MNNHPAVKRLIVITLMVLLSGLLFACVPYIEADQDNYVIVDDENNYNYKDHTSKDQAVDRVTDSMKNLLDHLDQDSIADQGYYIGADIVINSHDNSDPDEGESAFILKLRANLFTTPYPEEPDPMEYERQHDDPEYIKALSEYKILKAEYNKTIKKSDIVIEWYDGMTNTMLIGFYFDGVNQNMADAGNNLYLNLQGDKRMFENFGDSVLYQQIVRLITQFDINALISSTTEDTSENSVDKINELLKAVITNNYKQVLNDEEVSVYFDNIDLGALCETITEYLYNFFSPFENKIDPLTNKYLGFKFSTLGKTTLTSLNSDMQFFILPMTYFGLDDDKEIMTGAVVDLRGNSAVTKTVKETLPDGTPITTTKEFPVPFESRISVTYSLQISPDIVIDKSNYDLYEYGQYEFVGELFFPNEDNKEYELRLNALIRTDMNEVDNSKNRVFAEFRDQANDDLIIGLYYLDEPYIVKDQLTYIDIEGLQHLYGGIKFEDINLPKAYKSGFNLAELLSFVSETIDYYIVAMVDELLSPSDDSSYDNLTSVIMSKVESTTKTKDDPESRNTINITLDMDLLREILRETNPTGGSYDNDQLIATVNEMFGIDLDALASILGYDVEELLENSFFYITYDVDEYSISVKLYQLRDDLQSGNTTQKAGKDLVMQLDLMPTKVGRRVKIVFPDFTNFKPLKKVMTYSGNIEGQFIFAMTEEVDLSELMGAFIGDLSGKNTPYILPSSADIHFTMKYDQYIREQILSNGRWTRTGRSAFDVLFYAMENNVRTDLFHIYANDVSFNTSSPIEEMGYVWVDLMCVDGMPRMKIREDLFLEYFYTYMGYNITDTDEITLGFTDIIKALMEDSYIVFEPDVIRVTTSNQTIKNFFGVDDLIGTMAIQIGFAQRVKNIDELEVFFAMYSVGELEDVAGTSPYTVKLHDSVRVFFDYGTRIQTKDMLFDYDPDSIAVSNNTIYYYPTFKGLFMGVARSYTVTITGIEDAQRSEITSLQNGSETWEPLPIRELPDKVRAYYGTSAYAYEYTDKVLYSFVGYYDKSLDYYIIPNEYGYEILYDAKNDVFIVDLGTNYKYDKLFKVIDLDETVYYKEITTDSGIRMLYDIGSHYAGYYVVQDVSISILYYYPGGIEVVKKRSDITDDNTGTVTQFLRKEGFYLVEKDTDIKIAEALLNDDDVLVMAVKMDKDFNVNTARHTYNKVSLTYDMGSGFFVVDSVVNQNGVVLTPSYTVLYSPVGGAMMYTSEVISLEVGVDPTRNETKLIEKDFFLFNPLENSTIGGATTIQSVIDARKTALSSLMGSDSTIASYYHVTTGPRQEYTLHYDFKTGYYVYDLTSGSYRYTVVYDNANYYINKNATLAAAAAQLLGVSQVLVDRGVRVNWDTIGRKNNEWSNVEKKAADLTKIDWSDRKWNNIVWGEMPIEIDEDGFFTSPLSGGIFLVKVSIGKGMMATYEQYIILQILNRTVNTQSYVNVTVDVAANAYAFPFTDPAATPTLKMIAPVINENKPVEIDPYAYILLKADYVKKGSIPANFITWLFKKYSATITFTTIFGDSRDTAPAVGNFSWYFDDPRGSQIYFGEQDISNRVAANTTEATYLYMVFQGQVMALKLEIVPRTIDYLKFTGEEYNGTYTVDAIREDTYKIPQTPVIVFEEVDENGNPYTLDLANFDFRSSSVFANFRKIFGVSVTSASLASPLTQLTGFINWTNPEANNVKLINVEGDVGRNFGDLNGNGIIDYPYERRDLVKPFMGSGSDVDSSFFDIQGYVDPMRTWFTQDWFLSEVVTVIVLMPNKQVDDIQYTVDGFGDYTVSDINAQRGTPNGLYLLDPYDSSTWTLPTELTVRFRNGVNDYYTMAYPVLWQEDEHLMRDSDGKYTFRSIDIEENYFVVSTRIGNEKLGYIELRLLVHNLSGHIEAYEFLGSNGQKLAGTLEAGPDIAYGNESVYAYEVDTYARFAIPSSIRILFADGSVRTYSARWSANPPWIAGRDIVVDAVIGTAQTARLPLMYRIAARTVTDINFVHHDTAVENLLVNVSGRTVTVSGVNIVNGLINGRTPYEYLFYLLSNIRLSFAEISDTILVTDAALSVENVIYRTFDTQKIISPSGQTFTIRLGQGAGADDCDIVFKATGAKTITGYTVVGDTEQKGNYPMYDFRIYNDDNVMSYPNGFAIGNELTLIVSYSDGTTQEFGAATAPITQWIVSKPADFRVDGTLVNEETVTMLGIDEGDVLTVIPALVLEDGGIAWVSAMLPDGSRVYVRLMAVSPTITDNYSSDQYVGDFAISNGVIVISDYYKVYPIVGTLTVDKLPTSIRVHNTGEDIAGGIQVDNIVWVFVNQALTELSRITYTGCERFLLATAYIWGNKVELYLEVKDCTVASVSYDDPEDDSKDFSGIFSNETGRITVYFDAYHNSGYDGFFGLPENLTVQFVGGGSHRMTDTDYYIGAARQLMNTLRYNYMGYTTDNFATPAKRLAEMSFSMPDAYQNVYFDIIFYNKTVEKIVVDPDAYQYNPETAGTYTIDPYANNIAVPSLVTVYFDEGAPLTKTTMWIYPSGYEVKYDTYRRVLEPAAGYFTLESSLAYTGLNSQLLSLHVYITDRVIESWRLVNDVTLVDYSEQYSGQPGVTAEDPNAYHLFDDPFAGRATTGTDHLPLHLLYTGETNLDLMNFDIVWDFTDEDITRGGTLVKDQYNKYGMVRTGYIKNSAVGQPVTIRIYISRWDYQGIRKKVDGVYQPMLEPTFFFSTLTDFSTESTYQISILKTTPVRNSLSVQTEEIFKIFYPEDRLPAGGTDYVLKWDTAAINRARTGVPTQGLFYFANGDGIVKIAPNKYATYMFEAPSITELDFGNGFGTQNLAIFVINPFDPYNGMTEESGTEYYITTAQAKGTRDQNVGVDFGTVTVKFNRNDFSSPASVAQYIRGGIYANYRVLVHYEETVNGRTFRYDQFFEIMLTFLDMSPVLQPVQIITRANLNDPNFFIENSFQLKVRHEYLADTYDTAAYNPYYQNYAHVRTALNRACEQKFFTDGAPDDDKLSYVYKVEWQYTLEELRAMPLTQDINVYSTRITVNEKVYASNSIRMTIDV